MDSFLSFLPTLLSGGLTGLLGTGLSFLTDHFERKQRHAQELEAAPPRHRDRRRPRPLAPRRRRACQAEAEIESSANAALAASYREEAQRLTRGDSRLMHFADFVRTMLRPTITVALIALCSGHLLHARPRR